MITSQTRISKRVAFCAAHHIPGAGKCENNHGHNWVANITVDLANGELDERGFICDVAKLKQAAFKYDHDDLNKYFESPSTEVVAQQIALDALEICKENNSKATFIVNVHLIETENNTANASASNFVWQPPEEITMQEALEKEKAYIPGVLDNQARPASARFIKRRQTK